MATKPADRVVQALPWLDSAANVLKRAVAPIVGESAPAGLKDALVGTWLGHPLHPAIVSLPLGFWSSAILLDALGHDDAADLMVGAGLASAFAAGATGAAQWVDATNDERPRRVGALHAMLNVAASGLYGLSLLRRRQDHRRSGMLLSGLGYAAVSASGYLGGELSYDLGIGVSRNAFEDRPSEWTDAIAEGELKPGKPRRVDVQGVPVMLIQHADGFHAIGAVCPHLGAPLDEGEIDGETVVCPWHGSVFCLRDGSLEHGPAAVSVPAYDVRVENGQVQVRARG